MVIPSWQGRDLCRQDRGSSRIQQTAYGTSSDAPPACSGDLPVCALPPGRSFPTAAWNSLDKP